MKSLQTVEFVGGPLDGRRIAVDWSAVTYAICLSQAALHYYVRDQMQAGLGWREIFRHVFEDRHASPA